MNNEFGLKGNITDEDHMINILNNLPEDYSVIVDGLENHLMAARDNVLTMNMICKKLNHRYKKRKIKMIRKVKEKVLDAYNN